MRIPIFQVDAFTDALFKGNPAAVCPLAEWPEDHVLQSIAAENNLSETAFFVGFKGEYLLRWFTPTCEVELCGHATLAAAHVIFTKFEPDIEEVLFKTLSGALRVSRDEDMLRMVFPAIFGKPVIPAPADLSAILRVPFREVLSGQDILVSVDSEKIVRDLKPNLPMMEAKLSYRGVIVTAPGDDCDFVSRFFAPRAGIAEDPVTGSAHCMLAPFWAKRLGKDSFVARQLSQRGGTVLCELDGDKVILKGHTVLFMEGVIQL